MQTHPIKPKRPAVKWHGSKWRLAPWIIQHIPKGHDLYAEGFGGSAATLLQKERSLLEVYNDLDQDVFNYFQVLRDNTYNLIEAIKNTPYHHLEYKRAWNQEDSQLDPIERARRFYIRSFMSIMAPTVSWGNGFRRQKKYSRGKSGRSSMKPAAVSFAETNHLWTIADRLKGVTFESMDALDFMRLYDSPQTLLYLDPPYLGTTRARQTELAYNHEMITDEDHLPFLTLARGLQSMVLISGYANELYKEHLENNNWKRYNKQSRTNGANSRIESLWLNKAAYTQLEKEQWQN